MWKQVARFPHKCMQGPWVVHWGALWLMVRWAAWGLGQHKHMTGQRQGQKQRQGQGRQEQVQRHQQGQKQGQGQGQAWVRHSRSTWRPAARNT